MRCRAGKVHKSMSRCTSRYNSICTAPSCLFRDPICCRHHPPRCCDLADIAQSARSLTHATRTETHANASLEPTATAAVRYVKCQPVHVFIEGPHVYLPILSLKGRLHLTYSRSRGTCGMPSWMNMFRSRFPTARCRIGRVFRILPYVTHFAFQYVHTDVGLGRDLRQLREAIRGTPSRQHGWHARQYGDECCRQFSTFACAKCGIDRQQKWRCGWCTSPCSSESAKKILRQRAPNRAHIKTWEELPWTAVKSVVDVIWPRQRVIR